MGCFDVAGYCVEFKEKKCNIFDTNRNLLVTGTLLRNCIYKLNLDQYTENAFHATSSVGYNIAQNSSRADINIWHRRLGHVNFSYMKQLQNQAATGIHFHGAPQSCQECVQGKLVKQPFIPSEKRAAEKLELVHSDLCQVDHPSLGKAKYFLTFIDDHSRKVFLYFLQQKSQTFECFKDFKALTENKIEKRIKTLRSDNGGEYLSGEFKAFLKEHGIQHQTTIADNAAQNGRAERVNRTILDRIRCMLIDSGLSKGFWAEAAATAAYLINRYPKKSLHGKTSEEVWSGVKPDLSHLRIFGCDAEALIPSKSRGKIDNVTVKCKMLGYEPNKKGYRL